MALSKAKRVAQRVATRKHIKKLRDLGLIGDVKISAKPSKSTKAALVKYRDLLNGKAQAVKARGDVAKDLRKKFKFRGRGNVVVVPKEKGETYKVTKDGDLVSRRKTRDGDVIKKTISDKFRPRPKNAKVYYTLPERKRGMGRVKRKTFANLDELLFYLSAYDLNFEDYEEFIEVEEFERGSSDDTAMSGKIARERAAAIRRKARKPRKRRSRR